MRTAVHRILTTAYNQNLYDLDCRREALTTAAQLIKATEMITGKHYEQPVTNRAEQCFCCSICCAET